MKCHRVLAAAALVFSSEALAQLLGCAEVGCPMIGVVPHCQLDGMNATGIGISTIRSSISPDPLTWTIATGEIPSAEKTSDVRFYRKDFYFGQPPPLQLQNSNSIRGCAVIFEGISSLLMSVGGGDDGTCADAMTATCVSDLTEQANSILSQDSADLNCTVVARTLQASPPSSCATYTVGRWGSVRAHTIAGPGSAAPVSLGDCNPTVSKDYSLSLTENITISALGADGDLLSGFIHGLTPIMTIFVSDLAAQNRTSGKPTLSVPEVHLNCLQVQKFSDGTNSTSQVPSGAERQRFPRNSLFVIGAIGLLASIF